MIQAVATPSTMQEALQILVGYAGRARVIAGGTDLVPQMQAGEVRTEALVDVSRIPTMCTVTLEDGSLRVGAAVRHAELAASALIQAQAPVLARAAAEVGSPQIRNAGTIGGNVVNAQPAADGALALLALGAEAEIFHVGGCRWESLESLYDRPGISKVDSQSAILAGFRFSPIGQPGYGSAYRRLGKCKSIALPVLCAAAVVRIVDGCFAKVAIALGPVAAGPLRIRQVEAWMEEKPATPETIQQAAEMARQEAHPRDSLLRCSRAYRDPLVAVLVGSVLETASQEAL